MAEGRKKIRAKDVFEEYFLKHHHEDLLSILEAEEVFDHYSVVFNFLTLFEEHIEVAEALLASPTKLLPVLDTALLSASRNLLDTIKDRDFLSFKKNIHARVTGLPTCPELYRHAIPRTCDIGRLICVSGTVVRTTAAKMLEYQKDFMCSKCRHVFTVKADHDQYYQLNKPCRCPNPNDVCHSYNFSLVGDSSQLTHTKDYQEIKIQEQAKKLVVGSIPRSLWVTLEDDLVGTCKPGDDVLVWGTVHRRWKPVFKDTRPDVDLVFKANNISVRNKQRSGIVVTDEMREEFANFWERYKYDPLSGRNIILASFCPQVYGLYVVKLALSIIIAGGVQVVDDNGTKVRGESHLLLVGDPGTGKSQFLKYVSNLVPRCVLTTGIGTTNAGLTVAAVRDEGEWALEAGALVLADGGVCCIDEFSNVREADRAAIHEAMEQQTISVAKAGLVCKLNSRCTVLAATNPKGNYDPEMSLAVNVSLGSPLLSRFDLILVLLDTKNSSWDRVVSDYILEGRDPLAGDGCGEEDWSLKKLQAYFCHVRSLQPTMTHSANIILSKYYQLQRQTDNRSQARTTIRLLESLVRMSQGHARLMMRSKVSLQDAVVAVTLMEASMTGTAVITGINPLHTVFPTDPKADYKNQVSVILQKLGLKGMLSEELIEEQPDNWSPPPPPPKATTSKLNANHNKQTTNGLLSQRVNHDMQATSSKYTQRNTFRLGDNDKESPRIEELEDKIRSTPYNKQGRLENYFHDRNNVEPDTVNTGKGGPYKNKKRKTEALDLNREKISVCKKLKGKKDHSEKGGSSVEMPISPSDPVAPKLKSKTVMGNKFMDDMEDFDDTPARKQKSESFQLNKKKHLKSNSCSGTSSGLKGRRNMKPTLEEESINKITFGEDELGIIQSGDDLLNEIDDYDNPSPLLSKVSKKHTPDSEYAQCKLNAKEFCAGSGRSRMSKAFQSDEDLSWNPESKKAGGNECNGDVTDIQKQLQTGIKSQIDKTAKSGDFFENPGDEDGDFFDENPSSDVDFFDENPSDVDVDIFDEDAYKFDENPNITSAVDNCKHEKRSHETYQKKSKRDEESSNNRKALSDDTRIAHVHQKDSRELTEDVQTVNRRENVEKSSLQKQNAFTANKTRVSDDEPPSPVPDKQKLSISFLKKFAFNGRSNNAKTLWGKIEENKSHSNEKKEVEVNSSAPKEINLPLKNNNPSERRGSFDKENRSQEINSQNAVTKSDFERAKSNTTEKTQISPSSSAMSKLQRFSFDRSCSKSLGKEGNETAPQIHPQNSKIQNGSLLAEKCNYSTLSAEQKQCNGQLVNIARSSKRFPLLSQGSTNSVSSSSFIAGAASSEDFDDTDLDDINFDLDL